MEAKRMIPQSSLPRERLLDYGPEALSNQELLAVLLRTGSKSDNVMEVAGNILGEFPSLYDLKAASLEELMAIRGIGQIKAIELQATMELGQRIQRSLQPKLGKVRSSFDLAFRLIEELKDYQQEHFICLYLNTKNEIIQKQTLFKGSLNQSIAHPREIFRVAVRFSAARLIVVHNHPSGNPKPSENDLAFTRRLKECGDMMGIDLLDHIITGHDKYISLREEGFFDKM